jgi:valyl-tRNA synthetase
MLLMNLEGRTLRDPRSLTLTDIDRWIFHRLDAAAVAARAAMEQYRFNDASQAVYEFFWNDFCDWYIEAAKLPLAGGDDAEKDRIVTLLVTLLEESLRLIHPFLPLITEEIYQKLPAGNGSAHGGAASDGPRSIMIQPYPAHDPSRVDAPVEDKFASLQELVRAVRTVRSEFTIPPDRKIDVAVAAPGRETRENFEAHRDLVAHLIGSPSLSVKADRPSRGGSIPAAGKGFEAFLFIREAIDVPREIGRLTREKEKTAAERRKTETKLSNTAFVDKAPPEVVAREREKLAELGERITKLESYIRELGQ